MTTWTRMALPPGACASPADLPADGWIPAHVPGTVASAIRASGADPFAEPEGRLDARDHWYRAKLPCPDGGADRLRLDGLASIADVWWNGAHVLSSANMFVAHDLEVDVADENEIVLRFASLDADLKKKRPRPRYRAPMIENQQIRHVRTTLIGRTPGWTPPVPPIGPWRAIALERADDRATVDVRADASGVVSIRASLPAWATKARAIVSRGDGAWSANLEGGEATITVPSPALWWPHTHGAPALYDVHVEVEGDGRMRAIDGGRVGFRAITLDRADGRFALSVNGVPVFARGACWTPIDVVSLTAHHVEYAAALDRVVRAGMNMLRLTGPLVYEEDAFYDACDARGVLVWQDFMFANMDYPDDDPAFVASVEEEARQFLRRAAHRPSLALLSGDSEGAQQAAMWGADKARWTSKLTSEILPRVANAVAPDVPYTPSSAFGGAFPHQASVGATSYYGVGAYLRPLDDARRAEPKFASECLAFANVPDDDALPGGPGIKVHHPTWKARTPRDLGAGWDFDDVRDHYVARLFGEDPVLLRTVDHGRYLALGRVATGEAMAAAFEEWRRARSTCRGGLVLMLRDLWTAAGWGVLDHRGRPKAAWRYLSRALQPVHVFFSDEGLNGLAIHVANDRPDALDARVELVAHRMGEIEVVRAARDVTIPAHTTIELASGDLLDRFTDLTNAYRFGPPVADVVVASLVARGERLDEAFYLPLGRGRPRELDVGLSADWIASDGVLEVKTKRFAQAVHLDVDGFQADDDYFHVAPGGVRRVRLSGPLDKTPKGTVVAINAETPAKIVSR
ncbi:MAG: hypothetical protein U0414_15525 [Polyangiaceae bacterium]